MSQRLFSVKGEFFLPTTAKAHEVLFDCLLLNSVKLAVKVALRELLLLFAAI